LSGEPTLEELLEVRAYFRLPSPALVEKDFYVVKALAAIAAVELDALPCAARVWRRHGAQRAHRLIRRMSEDIDLRIVVDSNRPGRGQYSSTPQSGELTVVSCLPNVRLKRPRAFGFVHKDTGDFSTAFNLDLTVGDRTENLTVGPNAQSLVHYKVAHEATAYFGISN
jgi:hypothetical protein